MSNETALAVRDTRNTDLALEPTDVREAHWLATELAAGDAVGKAKSPGSVLAVILCGRELGLTAMQSIRGVHLIEGKPQLSADLMIALVRRSRACTYFRLAESTDEIATYETLRSDETRPVSMSFTMADGKLAGLGHKDNWKKYPRAMLRARAAAELARAIYPEVLFGIYVEGEIEEEVAPTAPRVTVERPTPRIIEAEVVVEPPTEKPQKLAAGEEKVAPLTAKDIKASTDAAPPVDPARVDETAFDSFATRMMEASSKADLDAITSEAVARFPDKTNRHRRTLGDRVYPAAVKRLQQGKAA
jgi:hypothetical protein